MNTDKSAQNQMRNSVTIREICGQKNESTMRPTEPRVRGPLDLTFAPRKNRACQNPMIDV
jgi:hypothetical protein